MPHPKHGLPTRTDAIVLIRQPDRDIDERKSHYATIDGSIRVGANDLLVFSAIPDQSRPNRDRCRPGRPADRPPRTSPGRPRGRHQGRTIPPAREHLTRPRDRSQTRLPFFFRNSAGILRMNGPLATSN